MIASRRTFLSLLAGALAYPTAAFATAVEPLDARVVAAVEKELGKAT